MPGLGCQVIVTVMIILSTFLFEGTKLFTYYVAICTMS